MFGGLNKLLSGVSELAVTVADPLVAVSPLSTFTETVSGVVHSPTKQSSSAAGVVPSPSGMPQPDLSLSPQRTHDEYARPFSGTSKASKKIMLEDKAEEFSEVNFWRTPPPALADAPALNDEFADVNFWRTPISPL